MKKLYSIVFYGLLLTCISQSATAQCCTKPDSLKVVSATYYTDTTVQICISWKVRDTVRCDTPRVGLVQYKPTNATTWTQIKVNYPANATYYTLCDSIKILPCIYYQFRVRNRCIQNGDTTLSAFAYSDSLKTKCVSLRQKDRDVQIFITPNPVVGTALIKGSFSKNSRINVSIANSNGKVILHKDVTVQNGSLNTTIETATWQKGVYFLTITDKESVYRKTFLKK